MTPTALADGNLSLAFSTVGYRTRGEARTRDFAYNSAHAAPQPVVAAEVSFPARSGLPPLLEAGIRNHHDPDALGAADRKLSISTWLASKS